MLTPIITAKMHGTRTILYRVLIYMFITVTLSACFDRSKNPPQTSSVSQQAPIIVGGAPMKINRTIIDNTSLSRSHTTLIALLERTPLKDTLQQDGPFTVFAPTNQAFDTLAPGTVEQLFKADNLPALTNILNYHIVKGQLGSDGIRQKMLENRGRLEIKTLQGNALSLLANGDSNIIVIDNKGKIANIVVYDVEQANGMVHVIDQVLTP